MTKDQDSRLCAVPIEHLSYVSQTVTALGLAPACKKLGLSRSAVLQILAFGSGMPGSLALLREAYAQRAA